MATDKYPEPKALNPFFDVVMKGLNGLVDGEHYYDAIAEDEDQGEQKSSS